MSDTSPKPSRRAVLGGVLGATAGVLGVAKLATSGSGGDAAPTYLPVAGQSMNLHGIDWRLSSPTRIAGKLPAANDAPSAQGSLLDNNGNALGQFTSAALPGSGGRFHLHEFQLADGTLLGMGAGALSEGVYAIVGGTGAYHGVAGSYTARQRPRELGGDGTADFELILTNPKEQG